PTISALEIRHEFPKAFHVSPFFNLDGKYSLTATINEELLNISISLAHEKQEVFKASLVGKAICFSRFNLLKTLFAYPASPWLNMPRIHLQAFILFFRRHIRINEKPEPSSRFTVRKDSSQLVEKVRMKVVSLLSYIQR
ncbi:MAG: DUF1365 family protein, partial [Bdellovibrionales bacterium]|nr:DUF1365 family protein [Bdellovibrionales bacterium]